jgi:hypothetical protein
LNRRRQKANGIEATAGALIDDDGSASGRRQIMIE